MKSIFHVLIGIGVLMLLGCPEDQPPQFRIRNDRSTKANVQVKTTGGNTININDVQPGTVSAYDNAAAGTIEATASIQSENVSPTVTFVAQNDHSYTIVVVNSTPPTLGFTSP